jgi:hypothetical protein
MKILFNMFDTEKALQKKICLYLQTVFPKVIYRVDFAAGMKMSIGQAMQNKKLQCSRAYPDLFIAEPKGKYCGLFIELKRDLRAYTKKDGSIRDNTHIQEQKEMLDRLNAKGYKAIFTYGYTNTIARINEYLYGEMD